MPSGCPHRVENLETSLAISANYVDVSNFESVKKELSINSLLDDRSKDLHDQLTDSNFCTDMDYEVSHKQWQHFKHTVRTGCDHQYDK